MVTGHTGFTGAWLLLLASAQGASVCGLSLPAEAGSLVDMADLRGQWPELLADITEPGVAAAAITAFEPTAVVHLAAQPLVRASYADPLLTFNTNVMGTARVLDACVRSTTVRHVLVVTTDKVYGGLDHSHASTEAFTESDPLGATDPYGASKVAAEAAASAWRQLARNRPTIVTARAGNVIGGGDTAADRLLPDLVRAFREGRPAHVRNPMAVRPWQHVLDAVNGYLCLLSALNAGREIPPALNFGPSMAQPDISVAQVCEVAASRWGDGSVVLDATAEGPPETTVLRIDSRLATSELGWQCRWNGREAVERTVDWWRSVDSGVSPLTACERDIHDFLEKH